MACPYSGKNRGTKFWCDLEKEWIDSDKHTRYCHLWQDFYNCPEWIRKRKEDPDSVRDTPV